MRSHGRGGRVGCRTFDQEVIGNMPHTSLGLTLLVFTQVCVGPLSAQPGSGGDAPHPLGLIDHLWQRMVGIGVAGQP